MRRMGRTTSPNLSPSRQQMAPYLPHPWLPCSKSWPPFSTSLGVWYYQWGGGGGGGGGAHAHPPHQQTQEERDIKAAIRQSFEELTLSELCEALVKEGLELTPTLANNRKGIIDILCDLQDMPSLVLANQ